MKTQGEQVDCMARSGLYHSRPASITSYAHELNTNRPKQTGKTQIKTPKTHIQHKLIFTKQSIIKINTIDFLKLCKLHDNTVAVGKRFHSVTIRTGNEWARASGIRII